jgi:hypothetical protein
MVSTRGSKTVNWFQRAATLAIAKIPPQKFAFDTIHVLAFDTIHVGENTRSN